MRDNLPSLVDRHEQLTRRFFSRICDANNCLNYLLPEQRHSRITNSHRTAKKYPVPLAKTTLFKNLFILYALTNFQSLQSFNSGLFYIFLIFYYCIHCINPAYSCHTSINRLID